MPVPKRYFKMSHEINHDPEVWELTDRFGDRSLRLWVQFLATFDKTENAFKLSGLWVSQLAKVTKLNLKTVVQATIWMIDRGWLTVSGDDRLSEDWTETARRLAGDWPKNHRRLAGDLPETHRRMVEEWLETGRRLVLRASNYGKYNRSQEQKWKNEVPLLSYPTPTPIPSLPLKTKKEEEKRRVKSSATPVGERAPVVSKTGPTWDAYAQAYRNRYGADPLRNAKTNGQLSNFLKRVPIEEAPLIAAFYLTHNKPMYVSARHSTDFLLRDAEGLRTEWVTGVKATTGEARNAEQRDNVSEQYKRVMASMEVKHG